MPPPLLLLLLLLLLLSAATAEFTPGPGITGRGDNPFVSASLSARWASTPAAAAPQALAGTPSEPTDGLSTSTPQMSTSTPQAATFKAPMSTLLPHAQASTSTPQASTSSLQESTSKPQESTSTQQESTSTQQESTSTQQESTSTQQESTSTPQDSTSTPQESTSTPQESTSTQQESTSTPQASTSTPETSTSSSRELQQCSIQLNSNVFECSTVHRSRAVEHKLSLSLRANEQRQLCCKDANKTARNSRTGNSLGSKFAANCSMWLQLGLDDSAGSLHCSDTCNLTIALLGNSKHYSLFLPLQHQLPGLCYWKLENATTVRISGRRGLANEFRHSFLCVAADLSDCFQQRKFPNQSRQVSASFRCPEAGDCYIGFNSSAATGSLGRIGYRDFNVEILKETNLQRQPAASTKPTTSSQLSTPPSTRPSPSLSPSSSPSTSEVPFEFRASKAVLASVLATFCALLCLLLCTWAYHSWNYNAYTSPLRKLFSRTPLHRLPTYTSQLLDLQLDRACSRRASSRSSAGGGPKRSVSSVQDVGVDEGGAAGGRERVVGDVAEAAVGETSLCSEQLEKDNAAFSLLLPEEA